MENRSVGTSWAIAPSDRHSHPCLSINLKLNESIIRLCPAGGIASYPLPYTYECNLDIVIKLWTYILGSNYHYHQYITIFNKLFMGCQVDEEHRKG